VHLVVEGRACGACLLVLTVTFSHLSQRSKKCASCLCGNEWVWMPFYVCTTSLCSLMCGVCFSRCLMVGWWGGGVGYICVV